MPSQPFQSLTVWMEDHPFWTRYKPHCQLASSLNFPLQILPFWQGIICLKCGPNSRQNRIFRMTRLRIASTCTRERPCRCHLFKPSTISRTVERPGIAKPKTVHCNKVGQTCKTSTTMTSIGERSILLRQRPILDHQAITPAVLEGICTWKDRRVTIKKPSCTDLALIWQEPTNLLCRFGTTRMALALANFMWTLSRTGYCTKMLWLL